MLVEPLHELHPDVHCSCGGDHCVKHWVLRHGHCHYVQTLTETDTQDHQTVSQVSHRRDREPAVSVGNVQCMYRVELLAAFKKVLNCVTFHLAYDCISGDKCSNYSHADHTQNMYGDSFSFTHVSSKMFEI